MAEKMYGYFGKMLEIDLTNGEMKEIPLEKSTAQKYVGGIGLAGKIIYDNVPAGTDPLSPQNVLVFPCGPAHGTGIPWSNRWIVSALSPETGFWGRGSSGGAFGPALKQCGYDAIIFKGKSPKPVYLHITEDFAELKDATHLWGKDSMEAEKEIRKELKDPDVRIADIGQAGEHLVRFAAIMDDMGRAAGRTGMGAVMGSKNLKAIAANGHLDVEVANPKELYKLMMGAIEFGKDGPIGAIFSRYGTAFAGLSGPLFGALFTTGKYWRESNPLKDKMDVALKMVNQYKDMYVNSFHCEYCPTGCGGIVSVNGQEMHRWEYEAAYVFNNACMVFDTNFVAKANDLCNRYGIDVISGGNIIAYTMLAREKGWISQKDTDGLDLQFGNGDAVLQMLHKIAYREGFGNVLAEGILPAARRIKPGAEKYAVHCKGLPLGGWDPRSFAPMFISYGIANRGGDHVYGGMSGMMPYGFHLDKGRRMDPHSLKGAARGVLPNENTILLFDTLPVCLFSMLLQPELLGAFVSAITGWELGIRDILKIGDRLRTITRLVDCRFGCRKKDDFVNMPFKAEGSGYWLPKKKDIEKELEEYYHLRGWSKDGIPTMQKVQELGIENVKEALPTKSA